MKTLKTLTIIAIILTAILALSPKIEAQGDELPFKSYLPFIAASTATDGIPIDIPVYEYTVRVHLSHFEHGTCRDILDDPPLDDQTRIEVYRLETGQVVAEDHGQVEYRIREDEILGFGFRTYHEAPRTLCPNLFHHAERWSNINGVYEIIDVYVYDPR